MSTERWRRLEQLFGQAMEQPAALRPEFLSRACGSDAGMQNELTSLLTAAERSSDFLAEPALDVFAREVARDGWAVQRGDRVGCYTIDRRLGAGGMGEVWRARDERLGRDVAIKLLLPQASNDAERARALEHEARAAGTLNHPNVVTVYDVGVHRGAPYLVTECLEGESLRARLSRSALELDAALDVALQVARGLCAAHDQGIVHRDLKPENVFITRDGRAKILDFGLAQRRAEVASGPALVAGTLGYMAPEQLRGEAVDRRADLFALGVILHEMLAGRRPAAAAGALGSQSPALSRLVQRCLAPSPDARFQTAGELTSALEAAIQQRSRPPRFNLLALRRRPLVMASAIASVFALAIGGWHWRATSQARWARDVAAPAVQRLLNQGELTHAFLLARRALDVAPDDPVLGRLWRDASIPALVTTDPVGAEVAVAPYEMGENRWFSLGQTPLPDARIPRGLFRVRVTKSGFLPIEGSGSPGGLARYRLDPVESAPAGMVRVVGGPASGRFGVSTELDDFWIDKFEITNRQFKEFVEQGGYRRREVWREPFFDGETSLSWDEAMSRFNDSTGRPGPATWKAGTYRDGQADYPVSGVSWYEAAAYAVHVGKSLPTVYHWYQAAALARFSEVLSASNFGGKGPAPVGSRPGIGPFGTYDMAGNVSEWAFNQLDSRRFLLGGAWNDGARMFANSDAKGAFERAPGTGFRLAKYGQPPPPALLAPIRLEQLGRDVRKQKPVSDEIFEVYRRQYAYDRSALNANVEETSETELWRKQDVSFDTAYAGERMHAYFFLPKNAVPPYQTIVFFPPSDVTILRSSREMLLDWGEPIVRSGRAFVVPIYKGTYERRVPTAKTTSNELRELRIAWSRDLGRTIDYFETRADIDPNRLTFYAVKAGFSAVVLTALEPRVRFSVLQGAGISLWGDIAPEVDALNYAPRVRVPTLMLSARYDFSFPVDTSQRPLFDLLGTPSEHKKHTVLEMGHGIPIPDGAREILPWLEHYLGPVRR